MPVRLHIFGRDFQFWPILLKQMPCIVYIVLLVVFCYFKLPFATLRDDNCSNMIYNIISHIFIIMKFHCYVLLQKEDNSNISGCSKERTNFWNIAISTVLSQEIWKFRIQHQYIFLAIWRKSNVYGTKLIELCYFYREWPYQK